MTLPMCPCSCHGTFDGPCDIEGGCGSVGCDYGAEPSERRCARGEHCQDREPVRDADGRHTGGWLARRIYVERGLCDACRRTVQYGLNHLTGDFVDLERMLGGLPAIEVGTFVISSPDLAVPIDLGIDALRTEIDSELQSWVEPVAEVLGIDWDTSAMRHTRTAVRVQRSATLLSSAIDTLLALGPQEHPAWEHGEPKPDPDEPGVQATVIRDGVEGALALLDLHRLAWATCGRTEYVQRFAPQRCTRCGFPGLVRHNGEDWVVCENCHDVVPWDKIPFFCRVQIDVERALQEERQRQATAGAA